MQETVPRVIEHRLKLSLEGSKNDQNEILGCLGGVLGALGYMNAERRADKDEKWSHFGATSSILCAILAPTGCRKANPLGVSRCVCRNRKNKKNHF